MSGQRPVECQKRGSVGYTVCDNSTMQPHCQRLRVADLNRALRAGQNPAGHDPSGAGGMEEGIEEAWSTAPAANFFKSAAELDIVAGRRLRKNFL